MLYNHLKIPIYSPMYSLLTPRKIRRKLRRLSPSLPSCCCGPPELHRHHRHAATPFGRPADGNLPELSYPALPNDARSLGRSITVSPPGRATVMDDSVEHYDALIRSGARRLTGYQRRLFQAEVATELCGGNARQAERRFGWGRDTVEKGLHELHHGVRCLENFAARGRQRSEEKDPQLAADIRAIVEPHTYADPELKSSRRYTNLSAAEVREALITEGLSRGGVAQRTHDAGHPQSHELPPQADSERQAAEEDQGDRRDLRQREGGAGTGRGTIPRRWRSRWTRRRRWAWAITLGGEKPGPTPTVK